MYSEIKLISKVKAQITEFSHKVSRSFKKPKGKFIHQMIYGIQVAQQLVEKSRCILPLLNLFPSLARRFACCQSCSVSAPFGLTALAKATLKGLGLDGLTEQSAKL